ncbi:DASS family sodium-coupled anion symporter [Neisseriaceae bacterium PsAf]|nr:DASS family sodium-coupled anion symporter [Neisseriaceae bacterium PsAf]
MVKVLCIFIFSYVVYRFLPFESGVNKGLALLVCIGILWVSEVIHITVTALLIPVIAVLIGLPNGEHAYTVKESLLEFANPVVFLFLGGFALSAALQSQKLDKKIAHGLIQLTQSNLKLSIIAIFIITAFLSMWMSNAATVVMMLPLALGLVEGIDEKTSPGVYLFLLLGISYSANLRWLGTYVGSPPNAIASQELSYGFVDWLKVGLPIASILVPLVISVLYWRIKPNLNQTVTRKKTEAIPWTLPRVLTIFVFLFIVLGWIFGKKLSQYFGIDNPDTWVAITGIFLFVLLGLTSWNEISKKTNWGVLLLFGGGLSLSVMLKTSGASIVLGDYIAMLLGFLPNFFIIFILGLIVMLMTEFTSNTATAALMIPVVASASSHLGLSHETLVLVVGICASCAFMLPVSTPPNAIVYGTGFIQQKQMISVGKYASLSALIVVTIYLSLLQL